MKAGEKKEEIYSDFGDFDSESGESCFVYICLQVFKLRFEFLAQELDSDWESSSDEE